MNLALSAPPKEHTLGVLNEVWKVVTTLTDVKEYMSVAEVFIEYPLKHCTVWDIRATCFSVSSTSTCNVSALV